MSETCEFCTDPRSKSQPRCGRPATWKITGCHREKPIWFYCDEHMELTADPIRELGRWHKIDRARSQQAGEGKR